MLFNSLNFALFFPIVIIVYFLMPSKVRYIWLLLASYFFYMNWSCKYALLLVLVTVVSYISARKIQAMNDGEKDRCKRVGGGKTLLAFTCIICFAVLAFFKYANFIIYNVNLIFRQSNMRMLDIVLPVGISFYTFQAISYVVDVYRGNTTAEKNIFKYALFVAFFPQLVAGPIERSNNLLRQINENKKFDYHKARDGVYLMVWGYFIKMVIADRIAIFVDAVYADINTYPGWYLIVATVLFAFQIYCDFAGYSTIAMGCAKIMGFELMDNFNAPYFSASVSEFWRRWHISLSSWFKDYLYIPLGGNRKGTVRKYVNLMIVFLISGLWHGASWTYVIWGGINGLYQVMGNIKDRCICRAKKIGTKEWTTRKDNIGIRMFITFLLIDFSWIFFRAESLTQSLEILKSMRNAANIHILFDGTLSSAILSHRNFMVIIWGILILMVSDLLKRNGICVRAWIQEQGYITRLAVITISIVTIFVFGIYGPAYDAAGFIYFQF